METTYKYLGVPLGSMDYVKTVIDGEYDIKDIQFNEQPLALDIGANMGSYTHWVQGRFGAKVIAYEPDPNNIRVYLENVPTLKLEFELQPVAITTNPSNNILYLSPDNPGAHSLKKSLIGNPYGSVEIKTMSPTDLPEADIIKADCEGCEPEIFKAYLSKFQPTIVSYEYHTSSDGVELETLLKSKGYTKKGETVYNSSRGSCNWLDERSNKLCR